MRPFTTATLLLLPALAHSWLGLPPSVRSAAIIRDVPMPRASEVELGANDLLETRPRKPTFYADAMIELKRLEEKPICHRTAAQLLMSNCQGLEDISKEKYQVASANLQRHHVESFAASLAMCDMERADFEIPSSCAPFRSVALERTFQGTGKLDVSPKQVSACLQGLGQDHSHWNTWLSYRDSALLLCRGARIEVDKDQMINLQKELTRVMEDFTTGLFADLEDLRENMANQAQEAESYFKTAMSHAENWKVKVHRAFESVTEDIQVVSSAVNSIVVGANDACRMMSNLVTTMIQSNAEMAAKQEQTLAVATQKFETRMGSVGDLVTGTEAGLSSIQYAVLLMASNIDALIERQNAMGESSQKTQQTINNAIELLENHTANLQKASETASEVHANLEKAAATALGLLSGGTYADWLTRVIIPVGTLLGGNYRTVPTIKWNLILLSVGSSLAESIVQYRRHEWSWAHIPRFPIFFTWNANVTEPSTFSQRVAMWKAELRPIGEKHELELRSTPTHISTKDSETDFEST